MAVKAIVFDLDGTFYPYSRMFSISLFLALWHPRFLFQFSRVRKEIRSIRPVDNFRELQAELLAERLTITRDSAKEAIERIIYNKFENLFRFMKPFPHLTATLEELKGAGYKLAVLSDFPVKRKLSYLGLDGLWDYTLSSEETNYLKPNREPFLKIIEMLKVDPVEILFVGDRYHYDVVGARQVGMKTAHFTRIAEANGLADFTFNNYKDFFKLVNNI